MKRHGGVQTVLLGACVLLASPGRPALAQLNETCVVSILNRSVQVKPDGSWVLPNVPANIGQVRVRATCVENGVTRSGQSDYFRVPSSGIVDVPTIRFESPAPIPSRLVLTAPVTTLPSSGATVQLSAVASYPDGRTADVSAAASGTSYTSSNPRIAPVGPDGLVTARASGTVLVTALNDGASALLRLSVAFSGDSDGDGISDDVELASGLDPNDPVDALEDYDRDGLTNREELQLGTDIRDADTDDDTLTDGREVMEVGTDPLVFDTDGDGLGDGLELATGSDPLDPASYNLARALQFVEVSPAAVFLVVNSLIGEASRQLQVTGHLIDGRTLGLTSRARGTNYQSSDLTVASFGAVDGQVFAGANGTATIAVSNSGFSAQVLVSVRSFAPTALSFLPIPGYANNVDVAGDFCYVAAGAAGLQIVDVSSRSSPRIVASFDTAGNANDVRVAGSFAYVADGASGLQIVDVSNPVAPTLAGALDTAGIAQGLAVKGTRVYLADGAAGLQVVDASDPAGPRLLASLDTAGTAKGVDVGAGLAVVADGGGGVRVVDVSNPSSPVLVGSLGTTDARDVTVEGALAYVADYTGSLRIVSLATPSAPQLLASTPGNLGGFLTDVAKVGPFVFGSDVFFVNGVPITHVGDPGNPVVRARLDFPARDDNGTGIAADGQFVYLTADRGIQENGVTGDTRLYIGQYLDLSDQAGIPPTVAITSPLAGSEHVEGTTVTVRAEASDDVGVAAVSFLVDGVPAFNDGVAPFEFSYAIPLGATSVTFGATAFDFASNQATAAPVTIVVVPDPGTTVIGRVVNLAGAPVAGATLTVFTQFTAQSGADGRFTIPGVPTVRGDVVVTARALVDGTEVTGRSGSVSPVPRGDTDVGDIRVGQILALIVGADTGPPQAQLMATGRFSRVDFFSAINATPSLATLTPYTVVLAYTNFVPQNPTALGNVLADYVDAGGGLVLTTYAFSTPWSIQGRVTTSGYSPLVNVGQNGDVSGTLTAVVPGDAVFEGVNLAAVSYFHNFNFARPGLAPGATLLATDGAGRNMIGRSGAARVVGLNLFPGTCCGGNQEFFKLVANALFSVR